MSFEVSGTAYGRFMGRYSEPLSATFATWAGVEAGDELARPVLDVGCGPGALTAELARRLGDGAVAAADPSSSFVAETSGRLPGVDVRQAPAEDLPWADGTFGAALAQLVVHFMADPVQGLREMARVTRPGGTVAACVWDFGGDRGPLSTFWSAVRDLDRVADDESGLAGVRAGQLRRLLGEAGLTDVADGEVSVTSTYGSLDEWWEPYTFGVGPAGAYVQGLSTPEREALRERCRERLPAPPFEVVAVAWAARGRA